MIGAGMFIRLLLVLHNGNLNDQQYIIFKCGYLSKKFYLYFIENLYEIYEHFFNTY